MSKRNKNVWNCQVLIVWRIESLQRDIFSFLIKLNETKCLFFWAMHKTKQIKLQFQNYRRSKRNEKVHNWIWYDQKKNINVCKGNNFCINKNETKRSAYISGFKKRKISKRWLLQFYCTEIICSFTTWKDSLFAVSLHIRIAHLQFHHIEGLICSFTTLKESSSAVSLHRRADLQVHYIGIAPLRFYNK